MSAAGATSAGLFDSHQATALESAADIAAPTAHDEFITEAGMLMLVGAYPERELGSIGASDRARPGIGSHDRLRVVRSLRRAVLAVAFAPIAVAGWCLLRLWWLCWWTIRGVWSAVTGVANLVWSGVAAIVNAMVGSVMFVCRSIASAVAAVVAFVQAVILGIRNAIVRTGQRIAAGVRAVVNAVIASVLFVGKSIADAVAAVVAFVQAVGLGIRNAIVRTRQRIATGIVALVEGWTATASFVRTSIAAAAAAVAAFVQAVVLGIRTVIVRTRQRIAAGIAAIVEGWTATASFVRRSAASAGAARVALTRAAALRIATAVGRATQLGDAGLRATVRTATAGAAVTGRRMATTAAAARDFRGTLALRLRHATTRIVVLAAAAGADATRRTTLALGVVAARAKSFASAVVTFAHAVAQGVEHGVTRAAFGTRSAATSTLAASGLAWRRVSGRVAVIAPVLGRALVANARSAAAAARNLPALAGRAGLLLDFTPLIRRAHDFGDRLPATRPPDPTVVRVAIAGAPSWLRNLQLRPAAIAGGVILAVGVSAGVLVLLVSMRPAATRAAVATPADAARRELAPAPAAPVSESAPSAAAVVSAVTRVPAAKSPAPATSDRSRSRAASSPVERAAAPSRSLSAARVRAIWARSDTRSLPRALDALRSETLAFHRCNMQMTSADRAVARCDEIAGAADAPQQRVAWTIDFRRFDDGWFIEDLSTSRPRQSARRNR